MSSELSRSFTAWCGHAPTVACSAGGRVNIIGEHTDYHDGFVLPAAISLRTQVLAAPRSDGLIRVRSVRVDEETTCEFDKLTPHRPVDWRSYVLGPFWVLRTRGHALTGADVMLDSDVPFGGGLSSSASVQVSLTAVASFVAGLDCDAKRSALWARQAENEFCHVPCGVMDQIASACGKRGHAVRLDCRSLLWEHVAIPEQWAIVVADSGVKHTLAAGEYAARQRQCAQGLATIQQALPHARALRDVSMDQLLSLQSAMPPLTFRRLRHVVTENDRVSKACDALRECNASKLAQLLGQSHESLAKDYEVSCPELDMLVDLCHGIPGVIGARLTGAGFGGNCVVMTHAAHANGVCADLADRYQARTGKRTQVRVVEADDGLRLSAIP